METIELVERTMKLLREVFDKISSLEKSYEEVYDEGYEDGYEEGYEERKREE